MTSLHIIWYYLNKRIMEELSPTFIFQIHGSEIPIFNFIFSITIVPISIFAFPLLYLTKRLLLFMFTD